MKLVWQTDQETSTHMTFTYISHYTFCIWTIWGSLGELDGIYGCKVMVSGSITYIHVPVHKLHYGFIFKPISNISHYTFCIWTIWGNFGTLDDILGCKVMVPGSITYIPVHNLHYGLKPISNISHYTVSIWTIWGSFGASNCILGCKVMVSGSIEWHFSPFCSSPRVPVRHH